MRVVRAVIVSMLLGALAFCLAADTASAETSFSGSCTFTGWSQFWPKRRLVPVPSGYHYQGQGTCDGTLNGKAFKGPASVDNYADMKQPMGCVVGGSTYGGPLYITFDTGAASKSSTATKTESKPVQRRRANKHHRKKARTKAHRARAKARKASVKAAASDPTPPHPPPSDQATPAPPAPISENPMLAAWTDEVNTLNKITSDLWGAYRGYGIGTGRFPDDPNDPPRCVNGEGIPGEPLTQSYTTITELVG
jgi:hypothetical protein